LNEEISNKYFGIYKEKPNERMHKYKENGQELSAANKRGQNQMGNYVASLVML